MLSLRWSSTGKHLRAENLFICTVLAKQGKPAWTACKGAQHDPVPGIRIHKTSLRRPHKLHDRKRANQASIVIGKTVRAEQSDGDMYLHPERSDEPCVDRCLADEMRGSARRKRRSPSARQCRQGRARGDAHR